MSNLIESFTGLSPNGTNEEMTRVIIDDPAILRLSNCLPETGDYVLQLWVKASSALTVELEAGAITRDIDATTDWLKCSYYFNVDDPDDNAIYFNLPAGTYYFYKVSLSRTRPKLYRITDKYSDKLGCDNGEWYIERNTEYITLTGTENWVYTSNNTYRISLPQRGEAGKSLISLCDRFTFSNRSVSALLDNEFRVSNSGNVTYIHIKPESSIASTVAEFKTWLASNNVNILLPAEKSVISLTDDVQTALNNTIITYGDLDVSSNESANVHSMRGSVMVKPIVFGTVNEDMSALVINGSDEEIGFIYQITFKGEVVNPVIYHAESNTHFKINKRFKLNDVLTIDSRRGKKSVTVNYRGVETNIINYVDNSSKWLQLQSGYNHLIQSSDSRADRMDSVVIYTNEYEGV